MPREQGPSTFGTLIGYSKISIFLQCVQKIAQSLCRAHLNRSDSCVTSRDGYIDDYTFHMRSEGHSLCQVTKFISCVLEHGVEENIM